MIKKICMTASIALTCVCMTVHADVANVKDSLLASQGANQLNDQTYFATYMVETSGPCAAFAADVPRGVTGETYRKVEYQYWQVRAKTRSITVLERSQVWVDDKLVYSSEEDAPAFTNGTDGENPFTVTYPDKNTPLLTLGTSWPYGGAEQPIMFGRGTGDHYFAKLLKENGASSPMKRDDGNYLVKYESQSGFVIEMLFDPERDWMCVQESGHVNGRAVYDRAFSFEEKEGAQQPFATTATQTYHYPEGHVVEKVWNLVDWGTLDASAADTFIPAANQLTFVKDAATAQFIKGSSALLKEAVVDGNQAHFPDY